MAMRAALHPKDKELLEALHASELLDTVPEEVYDRIVRLAAGICQAPVALISLVDEERQWIKAAWGLEKAESARMRPFCAHTILRSDLLVVEDALGDPRFAENELVRGEAQVRFYAGVPIHGEGGVPLGTLSVLDRKPRRLGDRQREALTLLAHEVESQIALRRAWLEASEVQHRSAALVAMVVHDMNSPLTVATTLSSWLISNRGASEDLRGPLSDIQEAISSVQRMASDLLDVALGEEGRLVPRLRESNPLKVFGEIGQLALVRARGTGHSFVTDIGWEGGRFLTDSGWIKRITNNFIENALKYAPSGTTVRLEVRGSDAEPLLVKVRDDGPGIPPEHRGRVFEKHFRLARDQVQGRPGAGLGLAFCKLAVETLGGSIGVDTNGPRGSVFWFMLPPRTQSGGVSIPRLTSARA